MEKMVVLFVAGLFFVIGHAGPIQADAEIPEIPAKGMVTMLDLGAKKCIP